ncbi:hypothetical protein QTP88_009918 [Uroleucon formosanum]
MTLPVSSYEELLETVRSLNQETRQLQRQLNTPLLAQHLPPVKLNEGMPSKDMSPKMTLSLENKTSTEQNQHIDKEKRSMAEDKEEDEAKISPDGCLPTPPGILADKRFNMWHSVGPTNLSSDSSLLRSQTSSLECEKGLSMRSSSQQQLGAKVEIVYNLLSLLENNNSIQSSYQSVSVLLAMSKSPDCCAAMRQTGCVPLLVQIVHDMNADIVVRHNASQALKNIVTFNQDEKQGRRESRVYKLLESMREYCDTPVVVLKQLDISKHPITAIAALMKLSFDSQHRFAMCLLGAIYTVTRLIQVDHEVHGSEPDLESNSECVTLRRYAGMALTNLTFGDATTKTLLCSFKQFLKVLILQLQIQCEDLRQVTASVLRNLSWRADPLSKEILRDVGAVKALMEASMKANKETTMKSFLSALWNFSAHSPENKEEICKVEGAIEFLIKTLSGTSPFKSVTIIENAGGILRNISCVIASHEEYRDILRHHNVLEMLMQQLQSPSLTIVSNACGTIWNLSARNIRDQTTMINLGIVPMLRSLIHSKHKMIATGSSAALNNLMNAMPAYNTDQDLNTNLEDISIKSTSAIANNTYLKDFNKKIQTVMDSDDLKVTEKSNLTKIAQQSYDIIKINNNSMTTEIENDKFEPSSIECSEDSIQRIENNISFEETVKKSSNGYAETSLDEATNYSLLCEDDDNGEKVLTGDTTQTYCTEGTPYNFSNAASYTDLRKCGLDDKNRNESGIGLPEQNMNVPNSGSETPDSTQPKNESKDGKMVTFETPLMFSRSSSIASLGSCEPQEGFIGSSAVSECSRITSGLVTPSEIPDSPTLTVPPSPPCFKNESVFEDSVTIFKEEKMPGKGSECTSLSSLTIDDDLPGMKLQYIQGQNMLPSLNEEKNSKNVLHGKQYESPSVDKMSKSFQLNCDGFLESPSSAFPYIQNKNPGFIPHARSRLPVMVQSISQAVDRCPESSFSQYKTTENEGDEIIGFCTEGTPANISTATSHSDLSMIAPSEDGSETNVILRQSMKMVGKKRSYQTTGRPLGNLNLQFNQTSTIPTSGNMSLPRSLVLDSPSTESHVSNSINSSEIDDPVTVINKRMSTDSIDSEFSLDDSGKCDNKIPQSHSLHDAHTLNSEPMSEDDDDDDDDDDNNALLDQCINAGIEKITTIKITDEELPDDEQQELLNQCIATGINNSAISKLQMLSVKKRTKKPESDLTDEQQVELLESCIAAGIKNSKKTFKNNSDDLSDNEQVALLNECIEAGMTNLQKIKLKEANSSLEQNEEDLLNNCISQGIKNIERGSTHKKREIPVLNKFKKSFGPKSESEFSESTSTITPGDIIDGIIYKRDESDESTWKDDETLTFTTLTSSYFSAGENSKPKFIKLDKGEMGIISSLDFEDTHLDAIKPPSDMESLLSMTTSVQSNSDFDKKRKMSNDRNDSLGSCMNIENINPPSYMDEVTDFEMENSITSISSIRSEIVDQSIGAQYYTAVDDLTLVDDLPSSEMSSDPNYSSPAQIRRRLTPKQKRNMKKDRYNTYTITSDDSRENSMEPETQSSPLNESDSHSSEDAIKKRSPKEKFQIKRSSEKDRFRTRTLADLDLTNIVQIRPKDNDFKSHVDESTTSEGTDGYSSDGNESNTGVASARIVKPSEVKAVRGKKKSRGSGIPIVARSSPQPPPTTSKSSQSTPTKKQTPLKRQGTFVKEESRIPTPGSTGKKHTSVPNLVKPPTNKQSTTSMRSSGVRNSVSNSSLKSSADQWAGSNSSLPTMAGVAKTNSNTSLNSNISATSSGCSVRTTSGQKKEATSKIATLWKKIEDNKKKDNNAKDNRVWISSSPKN